MKKNSVNLMTGLAVLTLTVLLSGCGENAKPNENSVVGKPKVTITPVTDDMVLVSEENGVKVFSSVGQYGTPAGKEKINVSLFVDTDGVVKDLKIISDTKNPASIKNQSLYFEGAKTIVIGKKLKDLGEGLDRVNGASLTGEGFKAALKLIQDEAAKA